MRFQAEDGIRDQRLSRGLGDVYKRQVIRTAINQELDRGGQIFYVLPRISDIDQAVVKLKNMFPSLKFIIAHGQMNETELENALIAFNNG